MTTEAADVEGGDSGWLREALEQRHATREALMRRLFGEPELGSTDKPDPEPDQEPA